MAVEIVPTIGVATHTPSEKRGPPVSLPDLSIPFENHTWHLHLQHHPALVTTNGIDPVDYGTVIDHFDERATPDLSQFGDSIGIYHVRTTHFLWENWHQIAGFVSDPDEEIMGPFSVPEVVVPTIWKDGREGTGRADIVGIDYEGTIWVVEIGTGLKQGQLERYVRGLGMLFPGHQHHGMAVQYNASDFIMSGRDVNLNVAVYR